MKSVKSFSRVRFFATLWTVAHKDPPSMGFSRQEYWSGLPFPSPGDLPNPGIEPRSPASQAEALTSEPPRNPFNEVRQTIKNITFMCLYEFGLGNYILSFGCAARLVAS